PETTRKKDGRQTAALRSRCIRRICPKSRASLRRKPVPRSPSPDIRSWPNPLEGHIDVGFWHRLLQQATAGDVHQVHLWVGVRHAGERIVPKSDRWTDFHKIKMAYVRQGTAWSCSL